MSEITWMHSSVPRNFNARSVYTRRGVSHLDELWTTIWFSCSSGYRRLPVKTGTWKAKIEESSRDFSIQVEIFYFKSRTLFSGRHFSSQFFFHVEMFISSRDFFISRCFNSSRHFSIQGERRVGMLPRIPCLHFLSIWHRAVSSFVILYAILIQLADSSIKELQSFLLAIQDYILKWHRTKHSSRKRWNSGIFTSVD